MLTELRVSNFAIIDKIHVTFQSGFNVLSGETGSGKSILLKSLALLMGEKSISDVIKTGCDQAVVEGSFDLAGRPDIKTRLIDGGISDEKDSARVDDLLVVKRVISTDGKNRVYVNGTLSTLQQLRDIVAPLIELTGQAAPLIEMTGQHENRHLQSKLFHLEALDQFIGATPLRLKVNEIFQEYEKVSFELNLLHENLRSKTQRLDFLKYQRDEICGLNLKIGDEEQWQNEIHLIKNAAKITDFIGSTESALYSDEDSALVRIHRILQKGQELSVHYPEFQNKIEGLQNAKTIIEETMYDLRQYGQNLNLDSSHLDGLEDKISRLRKLQKKYGQNIPDILRHLESTEGEIQQLENSELSIETLQKKSAALFSTLEKKSNELHKLRAGAAEALAKSVNGELSDLNMKGLIFTVKVEKLTKNTPSGNSEVEFLIQSSKKDAQRSLAKFASGGELSRILLSLKCVIGVSSEPRTYLFDEVDAGVSGVTAEKVGRKLKSIAKGQQVICVTHLPQVAAFASVHFTIQKSEVRDGVKMTVNELNRDEKIREIARMLSGEKITKTSLVHARELLEM